MIEGLGKISPKIQKIVLVVCCVVLFVVWLTRVPLTEIDEVRFSEATRVMQESGNYIIPQFNGQPRYQKPILYYWIQSVSVRALGVNEFAARLPSGIIALALVLIIHSFLLRWLTPHAPLGDVRALHRIRGSAFLGAFALATMPLFAIWARAATTDVTLTFFITLSCLALLQADLVRAEDRLTSGKGWYLLAACAAGLAFLTKGPIGLVLPGLAWLIYHVRQKNLFAEVSRVPWLMSLIVFLAVAAPWYAATYFVDGPGFLKHFFLEENVGRFSSIKEGHGFQGRFWGLIMYLPIAVVSLFPYSPFLVRDLFAPFAGNRKLKSDDILSRLRRFGWCWMAAIIGFFALSKTQLPSYIQSVAPAAATLFALFVLGSLKQQEEVPEVLISGKRHGNSIEAILLILLGAAIIAAPAFALLGAEIQGPWGRALLLQPQAEILAFILLLLGLGFLGIVFSSKRNSGGLIAGVASIWGIVLAVLLLGVAPVVVNASYEKSVDVGNFLRQLPSGLPIVSCCSHTSEALVYYSRKKIEWRPIGKNNFANVKQRLLRLPDGAFLIADIHDVKILQQAIGIKVLKRSNDILVLQKNNKALGNRR